MRYKITEMPSRNKQKFYFNQNLFKRIITIIKIPSTEIPKIISAVNSNRCVQLLLSVLIEMKESITERQSKAATTLANSSIIELVVAELMCKDVITMRQNPSKFAAVGRICCEVLLDI